MKVNANAGVHYATVEAVKILADGTRVPLGQIAGYHRNPFINFWWAIRRLFKR